MQLHHGDCLEVMATLKAGSVDAIITDPPYAIMGAGVSIAGKNTEEPLDLQFYEAWFRELARECYRVLKPTGAMWWTTDWRGAVAAERALARVGSYKKRLRLAGIGVWDRGGLGMGYTLRKTYECFAVAVMPEWKRISTDTPDVWRIQWTPGQRSGDHSAEKPVDLMERAIELLGGDVILDPFAGIGTTGIACLNKKRDFIGIEQDADYIEIARRRIEHWAGQPRQEELLK